MQLPGPGRHLRLKPLQVAGLPGALDLVEGRLTFGRAEDNDVCLAGEAFPSVSTHHARLRIEDGALWVEDLDSRNGTFVNDEQVERRALRAGDVLQLGPVGPRFLVVPAAPLSETMFVDPRHLRNSKALSEDDVTALFGRREKRQWLVLGGAGIVVVALLVAWGVSLSRSGADRSRELERTLAERDEVHRAELEEARSLIEELRGLDANRQAELEAVRTERDAYVQGLEVEIARTEAESRELSGRLARLEESGASADEIERLEADLDRTRADLIEAREAFSKFDPVNLEQSRLTEVSRVREAVVLLEVVLKLAERETGALLHVSSAGEPNFDGRGRIWSLESTGSGFCIDPEGWILTNAHVVSMDNAAGGLLLGGDAVVEPRVEIAAVFSDTSRRYPAEVARNASSADLALVKIEPFDYMPYLKDFSTETRPPEPGSDVYLFGFPLGNFALQEGERVIASTFRGILSRRVGENLQVDAGVHPGNSGGPITDRKGRVLGVVVSVQAMPDQSAVYTIGYGIPIAAAAEIWPRAKEAASDGPSAGGD